MSKNAIIAVLGTAVLVLGALHARHILGHAHDPQDPVQEAIERVAAADDTPAADVPDVRENPDASAAPTPAPERNRGAEQKRLAESLHDTRRRIRAFEQDLGRSRDRIALLEHEKAAMQTEFAHARESLAVSDAKLRIAQIDYKQAEDRARKQSQLVRELRAAIAELNKRIGE